MDQDQVLDKKTDDGVENIEIGNLNISNDVLSTIANIAALEITGVTAMSSGLADGIVEKFGKKPLGKGIKVDTKEDETIIDIFLVVNYGVSIPDVAEEVQENVKRSIEAMTGLKVTQVNIHVQGVQLKKECLQGDKQEDLNEKK